MTHLHTLSCRRPVILLLHTQHPLWGSLSLYLYLSRSVAADAASESDSSHSRIRFMTRRCLSLSYRDERWCETTAAVLDEDSLMLLVREAAHDVRHSSLFLLTSLSISRRRCFMMSQMRREKQREE